ncbi:hypothetical protein R6Q59_001542 [Mikania micrantha]
MYERNSKQLALNTTCSNTISGRQYPKLQRYNPTRNETISLGFAQKCSSVVLRAFKYAPVVPATKTRKTETKTVPKPPSGLWQLLSGSRGSSSTRKRVQVSNR